MTHPTAVFHSGDVYSAADPFATALAATGPLVSWVGEDEAARTFDGEHIDLDGDFLAPGFVHAGLLLDASADAASPSPQALLAAGVTTVHAVGSQAALDRFRAEAPAALMVLAYPFADPAGAVGADAAGTAVPGAVLADPELASAALDVSGPAFVDIASVEDLDAVLALLADPAERTRAQRGRWRLLVRCTVAERHIEPLARTGVSLTLDPAQETQPLAALMAAGAQLSFRLDSASADGSPQPWASLAAAVFRESQGISARAAFNAATRFAFRAAGSHEGGVLTPGADATAVRWRTGELVVQVADARLAAWSTDPRSGTAGLPDLSGNAPLPVAHSVWVRGARVSA